MNNIEKLFFKLKHIFVRLTNYINNLINLHYSPKLKGKISSSYKGKNEIFSLANIRKGTEFKQRGDIFRLSGQLMDNLVPEVRPPVKFFPVGQCLVLESTPKEEVKWIMEHSLP